MWTETLLAQRPTKRPAFLDNPDRACAEPTVDPEWFFSSAGGPGAPRAKAVCRRCPFQAPCLDYAVQHEGWGVWGATTVEERLRIRRQRRMVDA